MNATVLKILVSSVMFLLPGSTVFAQGDQSVSADLDGDGKPDKFRIKADKLQYQLSTQKNITRSSKPLDIEGLNNSVSVVKKVVPAKKYYLAKFDDNAMKKYARLMISSSLLF
jgi:hypothetical protein